MGPDQDGRISSECAFLQAKLCPRRCGTIVLARDLTSHMDNLCPLRKVFCPDGCGRYILGKDLQDHAEICPMTLLIERAEAALREQSMKEVALSMCELYGERDRAQARAKANGHDPSEWSGELAGWVTAKTSGDVAKLESGVKGLTARCRRKAKDRLQLALANASKKPGENEGPRSAMKLLDTLGDAVEVREARPWDVEAHGADELMEASYPYLGPRGSWQRQFIFENRTWREEACNASPKLCADLKEQIPTRKNLAYTVANNEMAIWFKLHAGSWVPPHSGACNTQINIHMSLWGETDLRVRDTWHKMGPGDLVCFDDSYLHEVENFGDQDRVAIVVRVMHPDMTPELDAKGHIVPDNAAEL